jgi:hypothetical protein
MHIPEALFAGELYSDQIRSLGAVLGGQIDQPLVSSRSSRGLFSWASDRRPSLCWF